MMMYTKCVSEKVNNLEKGSCDKEFAQFKKCIEKVCTSTVLKLI